MPLPPALLQGYSSKGAPSRPAPHTNARFVRAGLQPCQSVRLGAVWICCSAGRPALAAPRRIGGPTLPPTPGCWRRARFCTAPLEAVFSRRLACPVAPSSPGRRKRSATRRVPAPFLPLGFFFTRLHTPPKPARHVGASAQAPTRARERRGCAKSGCKHGPGRRPHSQGSWRGMGVGPGGPPADAVARRRGRTRAGPGDNVVLLHSFYVLHIVHSVSMRCALSSGPSRR
jgi:hypothetical protein